MRIAPVLLVLVPGAFVPGCLFSKVTPADPESWGAHYQKVLEEQGGAKLEKCQKGAALKKAKQQLTENIETSREPLVSTCKGLAGTLPKSKKDEECFLGAKTADAWGKCSFATTSPLFIFGGTPDAAKASWAGLCAGGSAGDDDADEDKPAKKKAKKTPKKGEDDDE